MAYFTYFTPEETSFLFTTLDSFPHPPFAPKLLVRISTKVVFIEICCLAAVEKKILDYTILQVELVKVGKHKGLLYIYVLEADRANMAE